MFSSFLTKIYFAWSGLTRNIKNLPGDPETLEADEMAIIELKVDEVGALFQNITALLESGISQYDIQLAIDTMERLEIRESVKLDYHVYYRNELLGLTILAKLEQAETLMLWFLTEESLACEIRDLLRSFHLAEGMILH
ncbi:hypothetical protein WMW72_15480 [Paenibacillus filicis]|uniref:Uncharacterized protein n=1 Tax=Paenibacillus filicis TaxID=669464 RepID=A0ABU9DKC8_9BACL